MALIKEKLNNRHPSYPIEYTQLEKEIEEKIDLLLLIPYTWDEKSAKRQFVINRANWALFKGNLELRQKSLSELNEQLNLS